MKGQLILPIDYKGVKLELRGKLAMGKYGYQFRIKLDDGEVVIEPDQQGHYKVAVRPARLLREGKIDVDLVLVIKDTIAAAEKQEHEW